MLRVGDISTHERSRIDNTAIDVRLKCEVDDKILTAFHYGVLVFRICDVTANKAVVLLSVQSIKRR